MLSPGVLYTKRRVVYICMCRGLSVRESAFDHSNQEHYTTRTNHATIFTTSPKQTYHTCEGHTLLSWLTESLWLKSSLSTSVYNPMVCIRLLPCRSTDYCADVAGMFRSCASQ